MAGVVILPEKILKKFNENILPQWKVCFFSALIVGLLAHLYKITNWLPNWDSLVFRYDAQNMIGLGRWFLPVVCSATSFYDLPFLNGIVAILFHAFGAVCICRIINVREKITAGLIGAVIVSFPTVTSVMMYNYVADGYSIAFLLSTLAALLMTAEKPHYIAASVLIALSTGIYQAYITVTIVLVLLNLIDRTIYLREKPSKIIKKGGAMMLSGILGVAIYGIVLKLLLTIFSEGLMNYQGINSSLAFENIDILGSLYALRAIFFKYFFDFSKGINMFLILNVIICLITVIHYVRYIVINKIYKAPAEFLILLLMALLLVCGAGALAFVNAGIDYHNLMLMGYAVFYIFFLTLYERGAEGDEKHKHIKCWILLILSLLLIGDQVVTANVSYHKAQMAYEKSYGVLIRIADRIEQTEGANECERILVSGTLPDSLAYSVNLPPEITGITDGYILRYDDEIVGQSVLTSALNDYCGKNYEFLAGEEKKELMKNAEAVNMGVWPEKDSIKVLDGVIVINLGAERG